MFNLGVPTTFWREFAINTLQYNSWKLNINEWTWSVILDIVYLNEALYCYFRKLSCRKVLKYIV